MSRAFTSARCCSRATTAVLSPFFTASISDTSRAAALIATTATSITIQRSSRRRMCDLELQFRQVPVAEILERSRAVPERLDRHAHLVHEAHEQIGHRRAFRILQVPSALDLPGAAARHDQWQCRVRMDIAVAQAAAVEDEGMIEQRAVAVGNGAQLVEEFSKQLRVVSVDLRDLLQPLGVVLVMRGRVMGIRYTDVGVRAVGEL